MEKIERKFVNYPIAVLLKELGFDEPCIAIYFKEEFRFIGVNSLKETNSQVNNIDIVDTPLWQDAIEWLKEKRILVTELWDGWEVAKDGDDFVYYKTKEEAVTKGLEILKEGL